jgi:hypothetical protein
VTPAEAAVLAAARAFRDAMADLGYTDKTIGLGNAVLLAAQALVDAPPVEAPTVAAVRPWPDPEAYRALACEVFGAADLPRDVPSAVAAWKALTDGQRVMCARGYQWTADRTGGRLRFTMAKQDGRPGKTLEQPWYPCIVGKLPVWPIVIEAAGN